MSADGATQRGIIHVGSRWVDRDPRCNGRTVTVEASDGPGGFVTYRRVVKACSRYERFLTAFKSADGAGTR